MKNLKLILWLAFAVLMTSQMYVPYSRYVNEAIGIAVIIAVFIGTYEYTPQQTFSERLIRYSTPLAIATLMLAFPIMSAINTEWWWSIISFAAGGGVWVWYNRWRAQHKLPAPLPAATYNGPKRWPLLCILSFASILVGSWVLYDAIAVWKSQWYYTATVGLVILIAACVVIKANAEFEKYRVAALA